MFPPKAVGSSHWKLASIPTQNMPEVPERGGRVRVNIFSGPLST